MIFFISVLHFLTKFQPTGVETNQLMMYQSLKAAQKEHKALGMWQVISQDALWYRVFSEINFTL